MRSNWKSGLVGALVGATVLTHGCDNRAENIPRQTGDKSVFGLFEDRESIGPIERVLEKNSYLERTVVYEKYEETKPDPSDFEKEGVSRKASLRPRSQITDFPNKVIYIDRREGDVIYDISVWRVDGKDLSTQKKILDAQSAVIKSRGGSIYLALSNLNLYLKKPNPPVVGLRSLDYTLFEDEVFSNNGAHTTSTPFDVLGEKIGLDSSHFFLSPREHSGPVAIGFGANDERLSINFENSKAYAVFSQPVLSLNNDQNKNVSPLSLVEGKMSGDLVDVVCKDPNQGKRFDRNRSVVYRIFNGEKNLSLGTANLSNRRLGGINNYLDYDIDKELSLRGMSVALVGDFEFLDKERDKKERVTTCSIYSHVAPCFPGVGNFWVLPSKDSVILNGCGFLDIANMKDKKRVSVSRENAPTQTAAYDEERGVILFNEKQPFPAIEKKVVDGETCLYFLTQDNDGKLVRERMIPIADSDGDPYFY